MNSRLSERLQEVKMGNISLRRNYADYAQLKQILGAEQIEMTLTAARQQEKSRNIHVAPLNDKATIPFRHYTLFQIKQIC